jgi:hypothetical protein
MILNPLGIDYRYPGKSDTNREIKGVMQRILKIRDIIRKKTERIRINFSI